MIKREEYPSGESLEPIACHLKHSPGSTGTCKFDFSQELRSGEGLAPALEVEEEEGRRTEATCRLNHEGKNGSGWEGDGGVDSGVVLSFSASILGSSAVLGQVGAGWGHLEHCCGRVHHGDVDVKSIGTLDELNIRAHGSGGLVGGSNLTNNKLHAGVSLLNSWIELLEELIEPVSY